MTLRGRLARGAAMRRRLRTVTLTPRRRFERRPPSAQTAVDAIPGLWASRFPPPLDGVAAGDAPLFEDERIRWGLDRVGGVAGERVLEIGPLDGGHTFMAHAAGAEGIVAVEANREAFLKCLVVKELFGLDRASFRCGDAVAYLEATEERFDVCLASGVLYHMADPVRLIELLAARAERLILWTHVYEPSAIAAARRPSRFAAPRVSEHRGFTYTGHRQRYGAGRGLAGFWGGTQPYSTWLTRDDLLRALAHFGFADVEVAFEERGERGPSLALVARRR